ncbi:MAG: hypothetical protein CVV52_02910 [Spirochaetae bacterium HGW-Spirochaetae-8]|nr:MAG: hypothetical protein CVV52_02910 [Spirochaetae bacterium HGW-Spirochaetae-8]
MKLVKPGIFTWLVATLFLVALTVGCATTESYTVDNWDLPQVLVNHPEVYYDGASWSKRAVELIGEAQESVVAIVFLGSWSPQTAPIYEALIAKAREGLPVYVVIDASSSFEYTASSLKMKSLQLLREHGVRFLEYNPLTAQRMFMLPKLLLREHRKFLVVDGKTVALGGMNFNYASLQDSTHPEGQRDSMYVFESPQLGALLVEGFVDFWNDNSWEYLEPGVLSRTAASEVAAGGMLNAWVADQVAGEDEIAKMFTAMFDAARDEVLLLPMMPFLSSEMKESVRDAIRRGVVVRMLLPYDMRDANREPVEYAALDLLDLGIELYRERKPADGVKIPLLHEKLMVVDNEYAVIGSANYNLRSMRLANEISLVVESEEFVTQLRKHFDELMHGAQLVTREEALSWRNLETIPTYLYLYIGG